MKWRLWFVQLLALVVPMLGAGACIFWLGWPLREPSGGALVVCLGWLLATILVGAKWGVKRCIKVEGAVANWAFVGFAMGTFLLGFVFLTPSVVNECGNVYYHYHFPWFDRWVEGLAERLGAGGC